MAMRAVAVDAIIEAVEEEMEEAAVVVVEAPEKSALL